MPDALARNEFGACTLVRDSRPAELVHGSPVR
jgi:hypothetical protein